MPSFVYRAVTDDGKIEIAFYDYWTETRSDDDVDGNDEDYEVEFYDSYEIPAGSYDFYVVIGQDLGEGVFEALAKPVKITVKVANAPAPKLSAPKSYKFSNDNEVTLGEPVLTNVWSVDRYGMQTRSANTNGQVNRFSDLFYVNTQSQTIAPSNDEEG